MKKAILILLILSTKCAFGQWTQSGFNPIGGIYELDFPSENSAYIAGNYGQIYKSTDAGINWSSVYDFGPFSNPVNLKFINADTGFVQIFSSYLRTFDGGVSWEEIGMFPKLKIVENNLFTSYTSNDTTYINKSIDFGNNWTILFQKYEVGNQPYILSVIDNVNAYFIHPNELDRVYKTSDEFVSIDTLFITTGDLVLQDQFDFKDVQNGYHYGSWGSQSNPTRTWNTGTFYFPIDLDGFGVLPVLDLDYTTSKLYASSLYGKIYYSINNGQDWTEQITPINDPIYSISFINNNKGIAISGTNVLYTNNGGTVGNSTVENVFSISIFPNPFSVQTILQSKAPLKNATLRVRNLYGETVKEINNISGQTITLFRENLSSGVYFLRLTENNKTLKVEKLIIAD